MSTSSVSPEVVGKLREVLVGFRKSAMGRDMLGSKEQVLAHYQPIFSKENLPKLTEDEFKSFLLFKNNHHWYGLSRQSSRICEDMPHLRQILAELVDEDQPLAERLTRVDASIKGLGKAVVTAILMVVHPEKYGVWNRRSEGGMIDLDIFPSFDRGETFGGRYVKINSILNALRDDLEIDLWTLDGLWWHMEEGEEGNIPAGASEESESVLDESVGFSPDEAPRFGLERHLHEFMRDNWGSLELAKEWAIYSEPGDEEAGYEYRCGVGRIDLLARHKSEPRWMVIELKRNQTSDQTVGQVLRYMGWVKQHLCLEGEQVEGLVVAHKADGPIKYALSAVPGVGLKLYEVEFRLVEADQIGL